MLIFRITGTKLSALLALSILLCPLLATLRADENPAFEHIPGGTLDPATNLIWSYDLQVMDWRLSGGITERSNSYAAATWVGLGDDRVTYSDWLQATYTTDELADFYPNGTGGWRLPTLAEVQAAIGSGFLLNHYADPYENAHLGFVYPLDDDTTFRSGRNYQTSTAASGYRGGGAFHFINLHILDPDYGTVGAGRAAVNAILVRSASSSDGDGGGGGGGGGNGGGGGKGKK